ncbi:MAG: GtrA family protein [Actinomycetota bacterium]|nr:MAG: GtrA family protein [Actinomycetota bacterium]
MVSIVTDGVRRIGHEAAKFGVVGIVAYIVDIGLFNLLRYVGSGHFYEKPLTAKVISTVVAATVAYLGNRHWTWRHRERTGFAREYTLFFLFNGIGLLISVSCLWVSHYALGLTSALADNISANVIGVGLATLFRFYAYRRWVFPQAVGEDLEAVERDAVTPY